MQTLELDQEELTNNIKIVQYVYLTAITFWLIHYQKGGVLLTGEGKSLDHHQIATDNNMRQSMNAQEAVKSKRFTDFIIHPNISYICRKINNLNVDHDRIVA